MILFQGCACLVHASIQLSPTPAEMEGNRLNHGDLSSAENATCACCICNRTEPVHLVYHGSVPAIAMLPGAFPLPQTRRAGWNTNCSRTLMMRNSKHLRRAEVDWPHLVQEEGGRLMGLALRVCGDRADAEDLVQETFLQAYRNLESFEGRSEFSTWLYTIASRICFRKRRRRAGQPERVESLETLLPSTEDTIPDLETLNPLEGVIREEIRDEVDRALAELPFQFRIPCLLKEIAGFSLAEIAEILGLKEATVKTRVHRARLILRKALSEKVPRKPANSAAHSRQICLDLLEAKQSALDHRLPFPLEDSELCARCRSVIITLGMTQEVLKELSQGELPESFSRRILHSMKVGHD